MRSKTHFTLKRKNMHKSFLYWKPIQTEKLKDTIRESILAFKNILQTSSAKLKLQKESVSISVNPRPNFKERIGA